MSEFERVSWEVFKVCKEIGVKVYLISPGNWCLGLDTFSIKQVKKSEVIGSCFLVGDYRIGYSVMVNLSPDQIEHLIYSVVIGG